MCPTHSQDKTQSAELNTGITQKLKWSGKDFEGGIITLVNELKKNTLVMNVKKKEISFKRFKRKRN